MGRKAFSTEFAESNGLAADRYPTNEQETQRAADALALDLEKLSMEEQEKLVFDIHGLPTHASSKFRDANDSSSNSPDSTLLLE